MVKIKQKIWRVKAEVELDVPREGDVLSQEELVGQLLKVKSGRYENIALGWITKILEAHPTAVAFKPLKSRR